MSRIQKTSAISLRNVRIRETSLLVTFFTEDFGKITAIAKGVRTKESKLLRAYEPVVFQDIVFYHYPRRDIDLVTDSSIKDSFSFLREDFFSLCAANYFVDLVDEFSALHQVNRKLFDLLFDCLNYLKEGMPPKLFRFFEIKLLLYSGLFPNIEKCSVCGKNLFGHDILFSYHHGGSVCSRGNCREQVQDGMNISKGCISSIVFLRDCDISRLDVFDLQDQIKKEITNVIQRFLLFHVSRELRSMRFMQEIKQNFSLGSLIEKT